MDEALTPTPPPLGENLVVYPSAEHFPVNEGAADFWCWTTANSVACREADPDGGWRVKLDIPPEHPAGNISCCGPYFAEDTLVTFSVDVTACSPVVIAVHHHGAAFVFDHHPGDGRKHRIDLVYVAPKDARQILVPISDNTGAHAPAYFGNVRLSRGDCRGEPYADGNTPGWAWDGTPLQSRSRQVMRLTGPGAGETEE